MESKLFVLVLREPAHEVAGPNDVSLGLGIELLRNCLVLLGQLLLALICEVFWKLISLVLAAFIVES